CLYMAANNLPVKEQLNTFFNRLNAKQKITLFIGLAAGLAILFLVFVWTARPNYEMLFTDLSQKEAGVILEKLKEQNIDYQLESGGGTILVPTDKVYELRLSFAQDGLPESGNVGYEIFDKTNLGMTDFLQQMNYRRALEGELSRTIEQIEIVDRARVHIVIPRETLFKEDEQQHSASVVLKLKNSRMPSPAVIRGIANLVAGSVEGMQPEYVSILDTRGRMLSAEQTGSDMLSLSTTQLEFTRKVEQYLTGKVQSMLDPVLGPGNAVVRVTADLNFTQVEKSEEHYDPEQTAVRSEEIQEESTPVGSTGDNTANVPASKRSNIVTNYEVNKTVQRIVEGVGNVERVSVAVLVNNKRQATTTEDGESVLKSIPRDEKEMQTLTELVRTAVGFESKRNDKISVMNVDFSLPTMQEEFMQEDEVPFWNNWYNLVEKIFLLLAVVVSMILMRSLFGYMRHRNDEVQEQIKLFQQSLGLAELPAATRKRYPAAMAAGAASSQDNADELVLTSEDFFGNLSTNSPLNEKLREYVREKPEDAARLIKVWLVDDNE
ncbi:MAG: flagellar basal-body MS-ring/collar protein FliF, partial [Calditrichia bacterium]